MIKIRKKTTAGIALAHFESTLAHTTLKECEKQKFTVSAHRLLMQGRVAVSNKNIRDKLSVVQQKSRNIMWFFLPLRRYRAWCYFDQMQSL